MKTPAPTTERPDGRWKGTPMPASLLHIPFAAAADAGRRRKKSRP